MDDDIRDTIDDDYYNNEYYNDDDINENNETPVEESSAAMSSPVIPMLPVASLTTFEVVHLPQKGLTAWLAHMQRKQRRTNIFDKIRELVF
jgi:hypothetical protein